MVIFEGAFGGLIFTYGHVNVKKMSMRDAATVNAVFWVNDQLNKFCSHFHSEFIYSFLGIFRLWSSIRHFSRALLRAWFHVILRYCNLEEYFFIDQLIYDKNFRLFSSSAV